MDFAIFLSTENLVLRAVARVSSGILNKEAPAFCRSHPHKFIDQIEDMECMCFNAIPEWNCCQQISSNLDSFTEFVGLNLSSASSAHVM
jgi:hypothetical protein